MYEYNINWLVFNKNGIVIIRNYQEKRKMSKEIMEKIDSIEELLEELEEVFNSLVEILKKE